VLIRILQPDEFIYYEGICQKVFFDEPRVGLKEKLKNPIDPNNHGDEDDLIWGVFDEKGKLLSGVTVIPIVVRINGYECKTTAIGGVVTLPEARGRGCVAQIMKAAFRKMRESGEVFSLLFPFSFPYYRQFGYEMCYANHQVSIDISAFRHFPYPARLESVDDVTDPQPFMDVYATFAHTQNLSVVRDGHDWEELLSRDPYDDLEFTFLHRDEGGVPDAYVLYSREKDDDEGDELVINELAWTSAAGLHGIFGFFGKLGSEFERVTWNAPSGLLLQALFSETASVHIEWEAEGMGRIVDVCAALKTLLPPAGSGGVKIAVTDAFLPENDGLYGVEWAAGKLDVCKLDVTDAPDMVTDVETLAQLVIGYAAFADVVYKRGVSVRGDSFARLDALFPRRGLYMMERY
jgi:predicted acetyltransferase